MAWIRRREKSLVEQSKRPVVYQPEALPQTNAPRSNHRRVSSLEVMEPRVLMAADTLWVGGVYFE